MMSPIFPIYPDERPPPLERPLDNVNLNLLISTPDERPPLLKGHFSDAKGMASQEGFHCILIKILPLNSYIFKYFTVNCIYIFILVLELRCTVMILQFIHEKHTFDF